MDIWAYLNPVDIPALVRARAAAKPFPWFSIDSLLRPDFAREVADAYPSFQEAQRIGRSYRAVHENLKAQVTDASLFPDPVRILHEVLVAPEFVGVLEGVSGISPLRADPALRGGGMHLMARGARLDVHVDFNVSSDTGFFRRLNILVFLNPGWNEAWGGQLEFWDPEVEHCVQSISPIHNRCAVFETSETSYHGVQPIRCPEGLLRRSFAGYYYTESPPDAWAGQVHSTIFRPRPGEAWRARVLAPAQRAGVSLLHRLRRLGRLVRHSR